MPTLTIPDVALTYTVDTLFAAWEPWVHLYMVDTPITRDLVKADLVELDVSGYVPQQATGWTPALISGNAALTVADPLEFVRGPGGDPREVFGYYVTNGANGPLLWIERGEDAPYPMEVDGDTVVVIPRYALGTCGVARGASLAAIADLQVSLRRVVVLDAVGDLLPDVAELPHAVDAVGDLEVTFPAPPVPPSFDVDAVGDLVVTLGPPFRTPNVDAVGDLVVTLGPLAFRPDVDAVGDLEVTLGPPFRVPNVDAVGDLEETM